MLPTGSYALRSVLRGRGVSLVALGCLSIAIGTNTAVFSIVNGMLIRDLPLPEPDRLVQVQQRRHDDPAGAGPVSYDAYLALASAASGVVELAAERRAGVRVSDGGPPDRYPASFTSANFFDIVGVRPVLGRAFVTEDERPGAAPVVLVSHLLWQERYAGDPSILGRVILVNGVPSAVVGVLPRELSHMGLRGLLSARLWLPLSSAQDRASAETRNLRVYGRLAAGVTEAAARARLDVAARGLEARDPASEGWGITLGPLRIGFSAATQAMFALVMGAVGTILLIACANVASLTLARTASRRHELATRLALGASRPRLVSQLVTESLIVAAASVPPGWLLAIWGRTLLLGPTASAEVYEGTAVDLRVLAFSVMLAIVATVLAGLFPAAHAVRRLTIDVLKSGGRTDATSGPRHAVVSRVLVGAQTALAVVLLVCALVFLQSFRKTLRAEGGFDTSPILIMIIETIDDLTQPDASSQHQLFAILDRLEALPEVEGVAAANLTPLRDGGTRAAIVTDATATPQPAPSVLLGGITAQFFEVLGVPVVQGRALSDAEVRSRAAVAVINRRMAERLWPGENPIGRRFRPADREQWFTIVGVSANILTWDLSDRPLPTAYVPYGYVEDRDPRVFLRSPVDPRLVAQPARAAVHEAAPSVPVVSLLTMTEVHHMALSRNRTLAGLFAALGGIALLLGSAGVYGVLSYFVSQRTAEIGIRAALGADPGSLVAMFVRQGSAVACVGLALGLPSAWGVARVLRGRLYNVSPPDLWMFVSVSTLLLAIALLAAYVPARRAAAVDPLEALRR